MGENGFLNNINNCDTVKIKLTQIFRYLQELNNIRNPLKRDINDQLWTLWFKDLPSHNAVEIGNVNKMSGCGENESEKEYERIEDETGNAPSFILKVRRPYLQHCPEPPSELVAWLQNDWQAIDSKVVVYPMRNTYEGDNLKTIKFEDDSKRIQLFNAWQSEREKWVETEKPARKVMRIFESLYTLQAQIERESERVELVVGDGLLSYQADDSRINIYHPVLLQRAQLLFEPAIPEFTIIESEAPTEFYTSLVRVIPEVNASVISGCRQEMENSNCTPLGVNETTDFLKRLVTQLSPYGVFTADKNMINDNTSLQIMRRPVIFLRHRTLGFSSAIEAILENIPDISEFPASLTGIVGIESDFENKAVDSDLPSFNTVNGEDERILLSKESNLEQLQIAKKLEKCGAVLVQGPPGTGKTHTIANLIGHLLAQGKSVLVTSHTTKALKVLQEKVVPALQPLCVSVLDDSRQQMERSIDGITEYLASHSAEVLEQEADTLVKQRLDIIKQLRETRVMLLNARCDEYRAIVVDGEEYSPSKAARIVAENRNTSSWIPSPVSLGETLPLTVSELISLYRSNATVTKEDEKELISELPNPNKILSPSSFKTLVETRKDLLQGDIEYRKDLWKCAPREVDTVELENLMNSLIQAVDMLNNATGWGTAAMLAGKDGGDYRKTWDLLLAKVDDITQLAAHSQEIVLTHNPFIPEEMLNIHTEIILGEMLQHVTQKGKIGKLSLFIKSEWKTMLQNTKVKQCAPSTTEHFQALLTFVRLRLARNELLFRWEKQITSFGGPKPSELGDEPERACKQFCQSIRKYLNWYPSCWLGLENELNAIGFEWDTFLSEQPVNFSIGGELFRTRDAVIKKLPRLISAQANRIKRNEIEKLIKSSEQTIEMTVHGDSDVVQRLIEALRELDTNGYYKAFERLNDLHSRNVDLRTREILLAKLDKTAPEWAAAIREREGAHGMQELPGDPKKAWEWRQLNDMLDTRLKTSIEEIQKDIEQYSSQLRQITALLIEKKAWAAQVRRTSLKQRMALIGWRDIIKRIGKGTGMRVPRLRSEARRLMLDCQSAVPVWIMPLSRVVENFDPKRNKFDVVIIDEASQADVMALTALYLGKQVVVVGDDEQVSPVAVGVKVEDTQKLIDEYLKSIPNAILYDGLTSVYDLAKRSFEPICLREHFRCAAPIIQFSNYMSYFGKIKPLREASELKRKPHTIAYRVDNACSNDKINEKEAYCIASIILSCTEQPEYKGATFGVISLVGDEQAHLIDSILRKVLSETEYVKRKIQCGNSAQFQGDERDVMFLSLVDAPTGNGPLTLRGDGANEIFKKRYNVAASRARDQMWVVHSLNTETDLKKDDIRLRLIQHALNPSAIEALLETKVEKCESEFERMVARSLIEKGFSVIPQWEVGTYRIDMIVVSGDKRVAVECDGEKYHSADKLEEDMARQAILERLGWRFIRIRGSQFFRNQESTMQQVLEKLKQMDITPEYKTDAGEISSEAASNSELKERIMRRASEIRSEWAHSKVY